MNKRNHEHYKDPTPYDAIKKLQAEADAADARRMDDAPFALQKWPSRRQGLNWWNALS